MSKITEYLKETKTELKHVIWPSKPDFVLYFDYYFIRGHCLLFGILILFF